MSCSGPGTRPRRRSRLAAPPFSASRSKEDAPLSSLMWGRPRAAAGNWLAGPIGGDTGGLGVLSGVEGHVHGFSRPRRSPQSGVGGSWAWSGGMRSGRAAADGSVGPARRELKESRWQGTYQGGATTTTASAPGITAMVRGACRAWDKTETALAAAGDGEFMFTFSAFRSSCDLVVGGAAAAQHQHGHVPPAGEGRHQQVEAASPEATTHHAERPQDGREL